MEATVSFTKNLKSVTNSNIMALKRRLNELKNTNNQGINNHDIAIVNTISWKLKLTGLKTKFQRIKIIFYWKMRDHHTAS